MSGLGGRRLKKRKCERLRKAADKRDTAGIRSIKISIKINDVS